MAPDLTVRVKLVLGAAGIVAAAFSVSCGFYSEPISIADIESSNTVSMNGEIATELWGMKGKQPSARSVEMSLRAWVEEKCKPPVKLGMFTIATTLPMAHYQTGGMLPAAAEGRASFWAVASDLRKAVLGQVICRPNLATAWVGQRGTSPVAPFDSRRDSRGPYLDSRQGRP